MPGDINRHRDIEHHLLDSYWKLQSQMRMAQSWAYWNNYMHSWRDYDKPLLPRIALLKDLMVSSSISSTLASKPPSVVMEEVSRLMKEIKGSSTQGIDVKSAGGATNINEQKSNMAKPRDESRRTYEEAIYRELIKRGILREGKKWGKWSFIAAGLGVLAAIIAGLIINPIATIVIIAIAVFIWIRWSTSSG